MFHVDSENAKKIKKKKKIQKIVFDLAIIAFELVALNTRFYLERIFAIVGQFVNKQFQDLKYYWN